MKLLDILIRIFLVLNITYCLLVDTSGIILTLILQLLFILLAYITKINSYKYSFKSYYALIGSLTILTGILSSNLLPFITLGITWFYVGIDWKKN